MSNLIISLIKVEPHEFCIKPGQSDEESSEQNHKIELLCVDINGAHK